MNVPPLRGCNINASLPRAYALGYRYRAAPRLVLAASLPGSREAAKEDSPGRKSWERDVLWKEALKGRQRRRVSFARLRVRSYLILAVTA